MLDPASLDLVMRLIWQATLVLVAVGLIVSMGLVLHRLAEERRERRHRSGRELLRRALLTDLNATAGAMPPIEARKLPADRLPIAETARLVDELAQIVRGPARERLADFAVAVGVEAYWLRRLAARRASYRHEAARSLALVDSGRTRAALTACLDKVDERLRLAAAEALAHHPRWATDLVDRLIDDPAGRGRHAARLWHRIATVAPGALVDQLGSAGRDPRLLSRLIEALGDAGHAPAAGPIEALVRQHGDSVDRVALLALQRLQHPAMLRVARQLATAGDPETRRTAITVLKVRARLGDLELLNRLASDPIPDIGAAARSIIDHLTPAASGANPA